MKLTKITAANLKGATFTLELSDLTLLVGSNFIGKSARGDAIRLALLGHLPELGKTAAATFGLCSGREMTVEAHFDDGARIFRRWYLKGDSVKTEEELPPAFRDGNAELIAVMMSADVYFGKTATERVNYVFANIPGLGEAYTPDAIREDIARRLYETEGLNAAATDAVLTRLDDARRGVEETPAYAGWTPQRFLDCVVDFFAEEAKATKGHVAVFEKTVQGLSHLRTAETNAEPDLAALDTEHRRLTAEATELRDAKAKLAAAQEQARATRRRREEMTRELAGRPGMIAQRETRRNRLALIAEARNGIAEIPEDVLAELERELKAAEFTARDLGRQLTEVHEGIARVQKEWQDVNSRESCPYCGAAGTGWRVLKQGELDTALRGLEAKRDQLAAQSSEAAGQVDRLAKQVNRDRTNRSLRAGKERELQSEKAGLDSIEKTLAVFDEKQRQLDQLAAPADHAAEIDALALRINTVHGEIHACEQKRRAHDGRKHELQRLAQAEKQRDEAALAEAVAKAAVKIVRAKKAAMVEAALAPILTTANAFFPDVLAHPLTVFEGEVGWWRSGTWVGHKTFSGTEKALAYAAIQTALSARAPFRFMLLDELGRLDDVNAVKLVRDIAYAVARGDLAQFVGIDTGRGLLYDGHKPSVAGVAIVPVEEVTP